MVANPDVVLDYTLFWVNTRSVDEAHYLTAVINSLALETALEPLMPKGQFGSRHVQKHLWRLPVPEYDDGNPLHRDIAAAAVEATAGATALLQELQTARAAQGKPTTATIARREIRAWLAESKEGAQVEALVAQLLVDISSSTADGG